MRAQLAAVAFSMLGLVACEVDVHTDKETARKVDDAEQTLESAGKDLDKSAREAGKDLGEGIEKAGKELKESVGGAGDGTWDEQPDTPARNSQ